MQACPNCQTPNPVEAEFCMKCGTKLKSACSNCGASLPPGARFCMNCGQPVAGDTPAESERLSRLAAATPRPLAEKMRAAHLEGERKLVTVLFADVASSTAMAEKMDPEDWTAIMNGAFERLAPAIHRYEGTIARLMGDALLVFFGAPVAHEDDPVRAILAGLDLLEAARGYGVEVRREYGLDFAVRVGLNTGTVVVGQVGSNLVYEYTAMGDAVNLAARMQAAAEPGTILLTDNTYRLAAPYFEFEDRGSLTIKGKSEPVRAYRVTGIHPGVVQARGLQGLSSPLVGRGAEMQTLQAAVGELRQGRGRIISVMGEAGLGKSRLVAELRQDMEGTPGQTEDICWLEGRARSYETAVPYAPFVDLFSRAFKLIEAPVAAEKYARVRAEIEKISRGRADDLAPLLGSLLGLPIPEDESERIRYLEPPQLRRRIFQAVGELFERIAAACPLVLVFEDLHWADPTSLDLIAGLLLVTDRAPVLILALLRPDPGENSWKFHEQAGRDYADRYTALALKPLEPGQTRELVANLLKIEDLPDKVRSLILKKAEGNPFFVEEVIRSLLDHGWVVREGEHWRATREIENISIPDTLVGVISARLDRLDESAKHTAQAASVIGRDFGFGALAEATGQPAGLEAALKTLQLRDLVREKARMPERAFQFKHALTQEMAYASILHRQQRELHARVAGYLERVEPGEANAIARHYLSARQPARALPYLVEAADRAARAYSMTEAIGLYERAVEILASEEAPSLARRAYEGLGHARMLSNDLPGAVETYQIMLEVGMKLGDVPMQVSALNKLGLAMIYMADFDQAEGYLNRAEQLAHEHNEKPGLAEMFTVRCVVCTLKGEFSRAENYLGESIELGQQLNVKEQMAYGYAHMSFLLMSLTRFDESWSAAQKALQVSREIGNLQYPSEVLAFPIPAIQLNRGNIAAARQTAQEGAEIASRIGYAMAEGDATYMQGLLALAQGEYLLAIERLERSRQAYQESGLAFQEIYPLGALGLAYLEISPSFRPRVDELHDRALELLGTPMGESTGGMAWADLGFCLLAKGDYEKAAELFERGLARSTVMGLVNRPRILSGLAYAALHRGDLAAAARRAAEAGRYVTEHGMRHFEPEVALVEARIFASQGDFDQALGAFGRAERRALALGLRPVVWQARAGASHAFSVAGRTEEAEERRMLALQMIGEMAELFQEEDLREMFVQNAIERVDSGRWYTGAIGPAGDPLISKIPG